MEEGKKEHARLPVGEKLAIAAKLRDVQEKLAPMRAANKSKRLLREIQSESGQIKNSR
jgi:hypothetical protein